MQTVYVHYKMKKTHRDFISSQASKLNLEKWEVISSLLEGGITKMAKKAAAKPAKKATKKVMKKK